MPAPVTLEKIAAFIQSVGFPVAVTAYILYTMNGTISSLTIAIHELRATLAACLKLTP